MEWIYAYYTLVWDFDEGKEESFNNMGVIT